MHVRNDTLGTRAILADGEYQWVDPGATVEVRNPEKARLGPGLVSVADPKSEVPEMPESLRAKAGQGIGEAPILPSVKEVLSAEVVEPAKPGPLDHDGKDGAGGSVKGFHSTAAKGARRRRSKAASK